jgi:hypothetical protein
LARGFQGTGGAPANHELPNKKFHLQNLIKTAKTKVVQKMMGHNWHLKPSCFFPLKASPSLALAGGFQGTGGGSNQSQITESKI